MHKWRRSWTLWMPNKDQVLDLDEVMGKKHRLTFQKLLWPVLRTADDGGRSSVGKSTGNGDDTLSNERRRCVPTSRRAI